METDGFNKLQNMLSPILVFLPEYGRTNLMMFFALIPLLRIVWVYIYENIYLRHFAWNKYYLLCGELNNGDLTEDSMNSFRKEKNISFSKFLDCRGEFKTVNRFLFNNRNQLGIQYETWSGGPSVRYIDTTYSDPIKINLFPILGIHEVLYYEGGSNGTLAYTIINIHNRTAYIQFLDFAKENVPKGSEGKTKIYNFTVDRKTGNVNQEKTYSTVKKSLTNIFLPEACETRLMEIVNRFRFDLTNKVRSTMGLPNAISVFLHGMPGTGKSCTSEALANEFNYPLYVINLSETEDAVREMISCIPKDDKGCVILFDEIDRNPNLLKEEFQPGKVEKIEKNSGGKIVNVEKKFYPLLDLMTCLDYKGELSGIDNHIIVVTSNFRERLDPRIFRPGRVHLDYEMGLVDQHQIVKAFEYYHDGYKISQKHIDKLKLIPELTMAKLIYHYIWPYIGDSHEQILKRLNKL